MQRPDYKKYSYYNDKKGECFHTIQYIDDMEKYCDWLEFQVKDWKKEWEYAVRVRRRCARIYYKKEKKIIGLLYLACEKLFLKDLKEKNLYNPNHKVRTEKQWKEFLVKENDK